jgi:probable HAF family extracellular repeat protein
MRKQQQILRSRRSPRPLVLEALEDRCLLSYTLTDLSPIMNVSGYANGINNLGQVVGASRQGAVVWDPSTGIQDLGPGVAYVINDNGQVGGTAVIDGVRRSVLWNSDGTIAELPIGPLAINNAGQVVDVVRSGNGFHAALWDPASGVQDLGSLGGDGYNDHAAGINDAGQVVGVSDIDAMETQHAFLWDSQNGMQDLGTLFPGGESGAAAINNVGQIVGFSGHAFLYENGAMRDLGASFVPHSINNNGQIVGWGFFGINHIQHGVIYVDGGWRDLNNLIPSGSGLTVRSAWGINDAGWITADALDAREQHHSVLLTPDGSGGASGGAGISVPDVFLMLASVPETAHIGPITNNQPPANTLREPAPVETVASLPANAVVRQATDALFASNHRPQLEASRLSDGGEWALEQSLEGGIMCS